jgi:hypothetical protein
MMYNDDAVRETGSKYFLIRMMFIMLIVGGALCINSTIVHADGVPQPSLKIKMESCMVFRTIHHNIQVQRL